MKKIIAMIPARIGSKRIPRKNLRLINGKPLIAYILETLKKVKLFDEIYLNADDAVFEKIRKVALVNIGEKLDLQLMGKINSDLKVSSSVKRRALFSISHPNSQPYMDITAIASKIAARLERNMLVSSNESGLTGLFKRLMGHF